MCILGTSNVFVADSGNNRIQNFSTYGDFYSKFGSQGSGAGQFNTPRDVCYDLNYDQLIVADTANNRLQIFQLYNYGVFGGEPTFVKEIDDQGFSQPMGVACAANKTAQVIYIADTGKGRVLRLEVQQTQLSKTPLHVWEQFKSALWVGDVDKAASLFIEPIREDYKAILQELSGDLQIMVSRMGAMSIYSNDGGMVIYEYITTDGSKLYPVIFCIDDDGEWKLLKF